jgi:hypothetical protein
MADPKQKRYSAVVCEIEGNPNDMEVYNSWIGYLAEGMQHVDDHLVPDLVRPIVRLIHDVYTSQNQEHTDYVLDWFAQHIQHPCHATGVGLVLYGPQGCGKSFLPKWHREKILGKHCTTQTAKPELDLFDKHSEGAHDRVFVVVEEMKQTHEFNNPLKNYLTEDTIRYERKNHQTETRANYSNIVFTTNNPNALHIEPSDRRFVLFECRSVYSTDYFTELVRYRNRPDVCRAWYQFLRDRDISHQTNFQATRPITDYYRSVQQSSIPTFSRWLSAVTNEHAHTSTPLCYSVNDFFKSYMDFHNEGNYKHSVSKTTFGKSLTRVGGVERKRGTNNSRYIVNKREIKKYLESINEYDPDAELTH